MSTPKATHPVLHNIGPVVSYRVDTNCGLRLSWAFHLTYSARQTYSLGIRRPVLQAGQQRTGMQVTEARSPGAPVLGPSPTNAPDLLFFLRLHRAQGVCCVHVLEGGCILPKFLPYHVRAGFPHQGREGRTAGPEEGHLSKQAWALPRRPCWGMGHPELRRTVPLLEAQVIRVGPWDPANSKRGRWHLR